MPLLSPRIKALLNLPLGLFIPEANKSLPFLELLLLAIESILSKAAFNRLQDVSS